MTIRRNRSWRDMLATLTKDPAEKHRIATTLHIGSRTIERWISGATLVPRNRLQDIVEVIPAQLREEFETLLQQDPRIRATLQPATESDAILPAHYYERIVEAYTQTAEPLRTFTICDLLLTQAMQIDVDHLGSSLAILQCLPPLFPDGMVRGTWFRFERQVGSWRSEKVMFAGSESLAGYVVASGQPVVIQNSQEHIEGFASLYTTRDFVSFAGVPIQRAGRIAGCFLVSSMQPAFFSQTRLSLIRRYGQLAALAFHDHEFYEPRAIALARFPGAEQQQPVIQQFYHRLAQFVRNQQAQGRFITPQEPDIEVRLDIARELLQGQSDQQRSETGLTEESR